MSSIEQKQGILDACVQLASKYKIVKSVLKSGDVFTYWSSGKKERIGTFVSDMDKAASILLSALKEIGIPQDALQGFLPTLSNLKISISSLKDLLLGDTRILTSQYLQNSTALHSVSSTTISTFPSNFASNIQSQYASNQASSHASPQTSSRTSPLGSARRKHLPKSLHEAARNGDLKGAKILKSKEDLGVNGVDSDGCTPLHYAAKGNYVGFVQWLLEQNAQIKSTDNKGLTAFDKYFLSSHTTSLLP